MDEIQRWLEACLAEDPSDAFSPSCARVQARTPSAVVRALQDYELQSMKGTTHYYSGST